MKVSHLLALLLLVGLIAPGCVNAPYGMSLDRHNFGSTEHQPKRVALVDSTNGQTVWSMDVPVGHTLVVDLKRDTWWTQSELGGSEPAHTMQWGLFETGSMFGAVDEKVELSGNPVYLRVDIREEEEPTIEDASYTPVEEPPLPDEELERVPAEEAEPETPGDGEQSPDAGADDNA